MGGYIVNFGYSDRARPDEQAKYTKPFKIEVGKTYTGYTEIGIGEYGNEGIKIDPANNIFEFGIFKGIHF